MLVRIQHPRSVTNPLRLNKIAFSDEKFFTLDGPIKGTGFHLSSAEPRQQKPFGGRSLFVWMCLTACRLSLYIWPEKMKNSKIDGEEFSRVLENEFPHEEANVSYEDNWSVHRCEETADVWTSLHMESLNTPPNSADLNMAEKVNTIISNHVYENGKQYTSIPTLRNAIKDAVKRFNESGKAAQMHKKFTKKLVVRMGNVVKSGGERQPDRWAEVIE